MGKEKWLSLEQKKVYQHFCATYFQQGIPDSSDAAYKKLLSLTEAQVLSMAEDIKNGSAPKETPRNEDEELIRAIRNRYTASEIKQLMKGVDIRSDGMQHFSSPTRHHKIGVMSDTHIGSIYSPAEWLTQSIETMQKEGCEFVLHAGDLTEGMKAQRIGTQMYEIEPDCLGYPAMRAASVEALKRLQIPMYIISGNHDHFFQDNADIVADVCERVPKMHYLGNDKATIDIDGAKVMLFHGEDGFSNVRLKNLAYSEQVFANGISMMLCGHVHKFEVKWIDSCYMVHVPTLQSRSGWMARKKLTADCGFLVLEFDVKDKRIINLKTQFYNL